MHEHAGRVDDRGSATRRSRAARPRRRRRPGGPGRSPRCGPLACARAMAALTSGRPSRCSRGVQARVGEQRVRARDLRCAAPGRDHPRWRPYPPGAYLPVGVTLSRATCVMLTTLSERLLPGSGASIVVPLRRSARPDNYHGAFLVPAGLRRSGSSGMRREAGGGRPATAPGTAGPPAVARLRAYWLSPPGLAMLAATLLALAIRLYTLTRPGYLTGVTEYDDGVYLGGAIRLAQGSLPYRRLRVRAAAGHPAADGPGRGARKISATPTRWRRRGC